VLLAPGLAAEETLIVDFLDVGQADCILVRQGSSALLIDAGNNEDRQTIESFLHDQKVERLEAVVATHAHEDHIGAMDSIITDFPVGQVWFPRQVTTTQTYRSFIRAVKAKGLTFGTPQPGVWFSLGTARCTFLGPPDPLPSELNEGSAVLRIDFGTTSLLFMGDAGKEAEAALMKGPGPLKATVLKVGHHGSSGSSTSPFLKQVEAQYAVISVGRGNTYGHPSASVVQRLKKAGTKVYRTDETGTLEAISDGQTITFTPIGP